MMATKKVLAFCVCVQQIICVGKLFAMEKQQRANNENITTIGQNLGEVSAFKINTARINEIEKILRERSWGDIKTEEEISSDNEYKLEKVTENKDEDIPMPVFTSKFFETEKSNFTTLTVPENIEKRNEKIEKLEKKLSAEGKDAKYIEWNIDVNENIKKEVGLINQYEAYRYKKPWKFWSRKIKPTQLTNKQIEAIKNYMGEAMFDTWDDFGTYYACAFRLGTPNNTLRNIWKPFANSDPRDIIPFLVKAGFIIFKQGKNIYFSLNKYKKKMKDPFKKNYETRTWEDSNFKRAKQSNETNK